MSMAIPDVMLSVSVKRQNVNITLDFQKIGLCKAFNFAFHDNLESFDGWVKSYIGNAPNKLVQNVLRNNA